VVDNGVMGNEDDGNLNTLVIRRMFVNGHKYHGSIQQIVSLALIGYKKLMLY